MDGILGRIVAVILGLLAMAGVGVLAYKAFSTDKNGGVTTDITQVITNARAQFSQNNNGYTNFTTANVGAMDTAGIFPKSMVRGGVVLDRWGNQVQFASLNSATQGQITFGGGGSENAEACTAVVTSLKDYVSLQVGGSTFDQTNQPDAVTGGQACANSLTLTLTFQ
ncbi:prepilin type IV pili [Burkholderia sp. Ac-20365]|uniref:prepilin type IV pili n=1 Tax=Burkholderia sp. Ac-20365 TaxID=2703897 RepID=UPI00197C206C|nr:prepilin type IV pili [Burkholderia sp. Ac-20365]MBN3761071.1 prepilin type IV pili [Burkholderia sp. Ac-20365]